MREPRPINSNSSLEQFLRDVEQHKLTINLDNGVYRDITVGKPHSSDMHYNITTRPDYLMFTGDMGCFVFQRLPDMFNFFRKKEGYLINPSYWYEKVQGQDKGSDVLKFSAERAERRVRECLDEFLADLDMDDSEDAENAKLATEEVDSLINAAHDHEVEFYSMLRNWDEKEAGGLSFDDWHEMDFTDFSFHYIWACYAIIHAIRLYDTHKTNEHREAFEIHHLPSIVVADQVYFDQKDELYRCVEGSELSTHPEHAQGLILWKVNGAYSGWKAAMDKKEGALQ